VVRSGTDCSWPRANRFTPFTSIPKALPLGKAPFELGRRAFLKGTGALGAASVFQVPAASVDDRAFWGSVLTGVVDPAVRKPARPSGA
jgi:hypothetical protein